MKPTPPAKKQFGNWAEQQAVYFLKEKGYTILARNYRYKRAEIDLITQIRNTIVFVEVKARTGTAYGYPEESVSANQQRLILTAAENYLIQENLNLEIRFDIISILKYGDQVKIYQVEDAFY